MPGGLRERGLLTRSAMRSALTALVALGLAAADAEAQRQRRRQAEPEPPVAWPHVPPPVGTMVTRAESVEREGARVVLEGYAQMAYRDLRIQADRIEIDEDAETLTAAGSVVFERGNEKVVAESVAADLAVGTAVFEDARGIVGQDFHFVAERFEEREDGAYEITNGAFTTCAQPNPRWSFTATRAVVRPEKNVWLRNVSLQIKDTPVLFLPVMYYPIEEDGRQSGFLLPRYSRSDTRGHLISQGYFWAINRSMDATLSVDHFTVSGTGLGLEYRYRGPQGSRGDLEGFVINDKTTANREYSLSFDVTRRLPGRFRFSGTGDTYSSFDFGRRFQDSFSRSTRRFKRTKFDLSGQLFRHRLKVRADRRDTQYATRDSIRQVWPQLSLSRRNLNLAGRYVQFAYNADYVRSGRSRGEDFEEWSRLVFAPTLGLSLPEIPFLDLRAEIEGGYMRYTGSEDPETGEFRPELGISRRFYGAGARMAGPKLERIFETPGNFYAARLKHLIEPEMSWTYLTSGEGGDLVRRLDRFDSAAYRNDVSIGLVNRVLAKRYRDGIEETSATDLITWRVHQTFYFEEEAGAFDSNYVSSTFEEESTVERSPIRSDFRFAPDQAVNGDWTMEWDPDERLFSSVRTGLRVGDRLSDQQFHFSWSRRARRIGDEDSEEVDASSYLRAGADFFVGEAFRGGTSVNYDISERRLSNLRVRADFLLQCCGVNVEWIRYNLPSRTENLFHFGITLGGLASFGFGSGERDRYY